MQIDLSRFDAVIYDMDGVLIDSEPVWKIAMEEVFSDVGCNLTRKDFEKTVGLRLDEVINYWYNENPWKNATPEQVLDRIVQKMVAYLSADGKPLTGVLESLSFFKSRGLKIGLATSSYLVLIDTVLDTLNIRSFFDVTHSAELEKHGKPHPAVYLTAADKLNVNPLRCLVIEDSINGVIAGKSARMFVVCIPEKTHAPNPKLVLADAIFEDLNALIMDCF
jgi:HAD superfamily hydrolase (TIGR01509 family)